MVTALGQVVVVVVVVTEIAVVVATASVVVVTQGCGEGLGVRITAIDIRQAAYLQQVSGLQEIGQLFVAHIHLAIVHKARGEDIVRIINK